MKIVIDIKKEQYEKLVETGGSGTSLQKAVINGTPLPKGHGRLGDLDALEELSRKNQIGQSKDGKLLIAKDGVWQPLFDFVPTIVPADEGE